MFFLIWAHGFPDRSRFSIPNHVTSGGLSPRSFFPASPQFSLPNHVTSGGHDVTSGSGHVTSGPLRPRSPWSAVGSHDNLSTNQMPPALDQSEASLYAMWARLTTDNFYLGKDGLLYHLDRNHKRNARDSFLQLLVPQSMRYEILSNMHDHVSARWSFRGI